MRSVELIFKRTKNNVGVILILFVFSVFTSCSLQKSVDFAVRDVQIFDGENAIKKANVFVRKGHIIAIDSVEQATSFRVKKFIDGRGKTLIPGLINAHCHLASPDNLKEAAQAFVLTMIELLRMNEDEIKHYRKKAQKAEYAYFYTAGMAADKPDGVVKFYTGSLNTFAPSTRLEAKEFIQKRKQKGVDFIKIIQDSRLPQKFSDTLFDALISETHKNNLLAVVHSEILADAEYEFSHGADIIAHGWVDRKISDSTLAEWKSRPFAVTPTLLVHCKAKKEDNPKSYLLSENEIVEQMGIVHRSGIPLLAGTDAPADGVNFTTDLYAELALYVDAGLTPLEALKTATSNPAKAYKLNERGVIRVGASADFVLVDGDVLKDISLLSRINAVWKQGKQIR